MLFEVTEMFSKIAGETLVEAGVIADMMIKQNHRMIIRGERRTG